MCAQGAGRREAQAHHRMGCAARMLATRTSLCQHCTGMQAQASLEAHQHDMQVGSLVLLPAGAAAQRHFWGGSARGRRSLWRHQNLLPATRQSRFPRTAHLPPAISTFQSFCCCSSCRAAARATPLRCRSFCRSAAATPGGTACVTWRGQGRAEAAAGAEDNLMRLKPLRHRLASAATEHCDTSIALQTRIFDQFAPIPLCCEAMEAFWAHQRHQTQSAIGEVFYLRMATPTVQCRCRGLP